MRATNSVNTRKRRKKWLKKAEGTFGINHRSYRNAKQTVLKASKYAYRDRKVKKRTFRKLWIVRLNAALRAQNYNYSLFMHQLRVQKIGLNRKMLSEWAFHQPEEFAAFAKKVMSAAK